MLKEATWPRLVNEQCRINFLLNEARLGLNGGIVLAHVVVQMASEAPRETTGLRAPEGRRWQIFIVIGLWGNKQHSSPHRLPSELLFPLSPAGSDSLNPKWEWSEWRKPGWSIHFGQEDPSIVDPSTWLGTNWQKHLMLWETFNR